MSINQFCTFAVPMYLSYCAFMWFFGMNIEAKLIESDHYKEGRIKIRPYGIITTFLTLCCLTFAVVYLYLARIWDLFIMFLFVIIGIACMKVFTYCVKVQFTSNTMFYQVWGVKREVPFYNISKIAWKAARHSIGYLLIVYCTNGESFTFSSRDYVGLVSFKETYETSLREKVPDNM